MRRGKRVLAQQIAVRTAFRSQIWGPIFLMLFSVVFQPVMGSLAKTDDTSLRRCLENLHAADADKNDDLSTDEYITFIDLESYGKISGNAFGDLPLNLVLIYYFVACLCAQDGGGPNCCVGANAKIDIVKKSGKPLYTQTFCSLAELGIYDALNPTPPPSPLTAMPSSAPNFFAPTFFPSSAPNFFVPTFFPSQTPIFVRPSKKPSSPPPTPKVTPSPTSATTAPTESPTDSTATPTIASTTTFPTTSPSQQPLTLSPTVETAEPATTAPTVAPSAQPPPTPAPVVVTSAPTAFQTQPPPPTASPSEMPLTSSPTVAPTLSTATPSLTPVVPPSPKPQTVAPTTLTPVAPPTLTPVTAKPTVGGLTCVGFQYALANQAGFRASDLLNMVNNTLRTGLIIATRNVTIGILNSTFPRKLNSTVVRKSSLEASTQATTSEELFQKFLLMLQPTSSGSAVRHRNGGSRRTAERTGTVQVAIEHALADLYPNTNAKHLLLTQVEGMNRRRAIPEDMSAISFRDRLSAPRALAGSRRLVYYTDAFPITIDDIFDNPFCPYNSTPPTLCAVVTTTVCVLLENGENETVVDNLLLDGFQKAINGGLLQDAIPPENQV